MSGAPVLIMAGGTGGHVFPALAVAEYLRAGGTDVTWLGTRRGLEARVVPAAGIPLAVIAIGGLRGKGVLTLLLSPLRIGYAVLQSLVILLRLRPGVVLGMGGFVSGPGGVAAWLLRRPLLIHEQNAVPGTTNRLLARVADGVLEAFPGSFPAAAHALATGNPVRAAIAAVAAPEARLAGRTGARRLLVIGGSLGARALNTLVPAAVAGLDDLEVRHQCGAAHLAATEQAYRDCRGPVQVLPFIDDMAAAYAWADLVVCRAGAMTVTELAAVGVAALLIPFPDAIDDHQSANAAVLQRAGAAEVVAEAGLDAAGLRARLAALLGDRGRLLDMARRARGLARADATARVAAKCREYFG